MSCGCMKDKKKVQEYLRRVRARKVARGYNPPQKVDNGKETKSN